MKSKITMFTIIAFTIFLLSCTKKSPSLRNPTVTDADGHTYETITIGKQVWMKQNLRVGQFADKTPIPTNLNNDAWIKNKTGACANYDGDPNMDIICGKLYNYYAIERGLWLPEGWRIATVEDWDELNAFLDITKETSGDKLKTRWGWDKIDDDGNNVEFLPNPSINNNSSGFSALPSGIRNMEDTYFEDRRGAYFWTYPYDNKKSTFPTCYMLGYNYPNLAGCDNYSKRFGMSVRCIKIQ